MPPPSPPLAAYYEPFRESFASLLGWIVAQQLAVPSLEHSDGGTAQSPRTGCRSWPRNPVVSGSRMALGCPLAPLLAVEYARWPTGGVDGHGSRSSVYWWVTETLGWARLAWTPCGGTHSWRGPASSSLELVLCPITGGRQRDLWWRMCVEWW